MTSVAPKGTPHADRALIEAVRSGLRAAADPAKAPAMQAYMKSAMPYLGVSSPARAVVLREAFAAHLIEGFDAWHDTALALWREATHREECYSAIALASHRAYRKHLTRAALPLLEEFIVEGAWWDHVDETAHLVGVLLRDDRAWMTRTMRAWSTDPHLWKRRVSIICQLQCKDATDLDLLYANIEANLDDRDFFIRKAIGWALRQYARTDPAEVARYVAAHADRLSPLSQREAMKHLAYLAYLAYLA